MKDYKKILEGIVNIISNTEESEIISNICSYIYENCPELKESEDEKIRKWLVGYFNQYATDGIEEFGNGLKVKDVIAWLEKQGEPKTEPTFLFKVKRDGKEYNVRGIFGDVSLELYDESESYSDHLIYASLDDCEIIKDGYGIKESGSPYPTKPATFSEQEPVKSKFQPGDWVVCEDDCSVHQIKGCFENLNNHTYDYELTEDGHISSDDVNKWHLWTFEDAKDTDVLIDKDGHPFIFNGYFTSQTINGYCGLVSGMFISGVHLWIKDVKPATKEQRNLLEKAMAEAGYTFDFEKGGLNKITKFKIGDWVVEPREDESDVLWHIEKIENGSYWDGSVGTSIEYADKYYHVWNLEEDANDGEILISSITNKPFIYNGKFNENHVGAYCGVGYDDEFVIARTQYFWTEKKDIAPATKEQRDFLFERMKEADYMWDFSNKKPIKIETK